MGYFENEKLIYLEILTKIVFLTKYFKIFPKKLYYQLIVIFGHYQAITDAEEPIALTRPEKTLKPHDIDLIFSLLFTIASTENNFN